MRYLIGSPILLAFLYTALQSWMYVAARPGSAPNQGAMLIAFLIFVAGGITAFVFFAKGIVLVAQGYLWAGKGAKASGRNASPQAAPQKALNE